MKAIICGGRNMHLTLKDCESLSLMHDLFHFDMVITGGAPGIDTDALKWAELNNIATKTYPADWIRYGKQAGPIRNRQMLREAGTDAVVIAFPGGRGTFDMVNAAKARHIRVVHSGTVIHDENLSRNGSYD